MTLAKDPIVLNSALVSISFTRHYDCVTSLIADNFSPKISGSFLLLQGCYVASTSLHKN